MAKDDRSSSSGGNDNLLAALGPGLLWAGTAVGVSHLVQSTRAGAGYGMTLLTVVLIANLLKYPAFEATIAAGSPPGVTPRKEYRPSASVRGSSRRLPGAPTESPQRWRP